MKNILLAIANLLVLSAGFYTQADPMSGGSPDPELSRVYETIEALNTVIYECPDKIFPDGKNNKFKDVTFVFSTKRQDKDSLNSEPKDSRVRSWAWNLPSKRSSEELKYVNKNHIQDGEHQ